MESLFETLEDYFYQLPDIVYAVVFFLIGWLVAALIARLVKAVLAKTKWDDKLFEYIKIDSKYKSHVIISKIVFYVLMIFVVILFFNILGLQIVAEPIVNMMNIVAESIPSIFKAALILIIGWMIASVLSFLIQTGGKKIGIDRLLTKWSIIRNPENSEKALQSAGRIVFYLVLLLFIPGVLGALQISAVSGPMSNMLSQFLEFLPKLFGAALILLIGWLAAKIVREILTKFLFTIGVEKLSERFGLSKIFSNTNISAVIGTVAYVLILIPTVIAALETLDIQGISEPAVAMLSSILSMLPNVIISILLILIGVWLGKVVGNLVASLLEKLGFNGILNYLGLRAVDSSSTNLTASQIVGRVTQLIIILFFTAEALQIVKLQVLVTFVTALIAYLPNLLVAIVVIGIGLFLGNFAQRTIASLVKDNYKLLSVVAKYAIIVVSSFMALDQLGVADSIVNAAFILTLGGLALAFGLAFGLGGREFAASIMKQWQSRLEAKETKQQQNDDHNG
ncbi:mechanosensitive ion channel [Paenibacillus chungangensis]|uniref:Mechanosensitive ion channel n=1 Tax=Paenibacillus chungangensis TaxID=696535 RepID=A0ABW3HLK2_9BACL